MADALELHKIYGSGHDTAAETVIGDGRRQHHPGVPRRDCGPARQGRPGPGPGRAGHPGQAGRRGHPSRHRAAPQRMGWPKPVRRYRSARDPRLGPTKASPARSQATADRRGVVRGFLLRSQVGAADSMALMRKQGPLAARWRHSCPATVGGPETYRALAICEPRRHPHVRDTGRHRWRTIGQTIVQSSEALVDTKARLAS